MGAPESQAPRSRLTSPLQWLRWIVLTLSTSWLFLGALVHLSRATPTAFTTRWAPWSQQLPPGARDDLTSVLGAPWSLSVAGFEILDPVAAVSLFLQGRFSTEALVGVLPSLALVLLAGRFFCGWICPYRALLGSANAAREILAKLGVPVLDLDLGRRSAFLVLLGLAAASAIAGHQLIGLAYPPSVLGRSVLEGVFFGGLSAGLWLIAAAWIFDATLARAGFCRSVCPGGAIFRALGAPAPLQIRRDPDACVHCHACDEVCNLGQHPMSDRHTTGCERCGSCAAVCPTDALRFTLGRPLPILPPDRHPRSDDA